MSESQHKPSFQGHDFAFDDQGERVQIHRPPAPTPEHELMDEIVEALAGKPMPDYLFAQTPAERETMERVKQKITDAFELARDREMLKTVAYILAQIDDELDAALLKRLFMFGAIPRQQLAKSAGMSEMGVWKREKKLRDKLGSLFTQFKTSQSEKHV